MIEQIKERFLKEKQGIYEAISRDYKSNDLKVDYNQLLDVFNKTSKEELKKDNKQKVITVVYNGNPCITLELALMGIINNTNLILISDNIMNNLNNQIIDIMKSIIEEMNLKIIIKWYPDGDIDKISEIENIANKVVFLGDKRIYRKLKNKVNIPIIYNGYGSIIIYTDNQDEFEAEIYDIKDYAIENNISVNIYNDEIDEDIEYINKDGINHISIIFSNDTSKIQKFKEKVQSDYILVNSIKINEIPSSISVDILD